MVAIKYCKSSIKTPGGLFISNPFEGGLIEMEGLFERGGLFNLEMTMVRTRRIQSGKAQVQEVLGHAAEDQHQIQTSSW